MDRVGGEVVMAVLKYKSGGTWHEVPLTKGDKGYKGGIGDQGGKGGIGPQGPSGPQGSPGSPPGQTFRYGEAYIVPVANTPTSTGIPFSPPFSQNPMTFACARTTVPGTVRACSVLTGPSTTGAEVSVCRTNTTGTYVRWFAVGIGGP